MVNYHMPLKSMVRILLFNSKFKPEKPFNLKVLKIDISEFENILFFRESKLKRNIN